MRPAPAGRTAPNGRTARRSHQSAANRPSAPDLGRTLRQSSPKGRRVPPGGPHERNTETRARYRDALPQLADAPVPDGRRDRDHAHLPRRPRAAPLRGLRPLEPRRRGRGASPLLRAVCRDRPGERRRHRPRDGHVAGEPGLGRAPRSRPGGARRAEPAGRAPARGDPRGLRDGGDADRHLGLRRPARRRVRRRRGDDRRGGRGVPRRSRSAPSRPPPPTSSRRSR